MTTITTEGSARPWGGVCEGLDVNHGAKTTTYYPDPTLQKRPPEGMSGVSEIIWGIISATNGRCPAVPSGGVL